MEKDRFRLGIIGSLIIALIILGVYLSLEIGDNHMSSRSVVADSDDTLDLGITYLTVTPQVAMHYGLAVDSGALVTEVSKGSLADQVGVKTGDVITYFNGSAVGQQSPLLGMMRGCHMGRQVMMEVWRGNTSWIVELTHR